MASRNQYKYNIGDVLTSVSGDVFEILSSDRDIEGSTGNVTIRFLETGFTQTMSAGHMNTLKVKDWSKPSVFGVGYFSDLEGLCRTYTRDGKKVNTPAYEVWLGMLKRCYSPGSRRYKDYGAKGVTVCEEWHDFVKFNEWFNKHHSSGFHMDKDILSEGFKGKCYSPETCTFVPNCVNTFFTNSRRARGLYPVGVYRKDNRNGDVRYIAQVGNLDDRQDYLGRFETMHEAFMAYKVAREGLAKKLAEREYMKGTISKEVYERMLGWQAVPYP